jgi:parallel beta-helix repeat protein
MTTDNMPFKPLLMLFLLILLSSFKSVDETSGITLTVESDKTIPAHDSQIVIRSDYDLENKTLELQEGSSIVIEDGCIRNGIIRLASNCSLVDKRVNKKECRNLELRVVGRNVRIENIAISNDHGVPILSNADCSNLLISGCSITSSANNAVKIVADNLNGVVKNVQILNSTICYKRMGIEIQNHGNKSFKFNGIHISGCTFNMLPSPQYGFAISLSGFGRNAVIENNRINDGVIGVEIVDFCNVDLLRNCISGVSSKAIAASSNSKIVKVVVENNVINCKEAKLQFLRTNSLQMKNNEMNVNYIELGGCSKCIISDNILSSYGRYSIVIDGSGGDARKNTIINNQICQLGDNWAVFRCYGEQSKSNKFLKNRIRRTNTKGVLFDQLKGATSNRLE